MIFSRYFYEVFPEKIKQYFYDTRLRIKDGIECVSTDELCCEKSFGIVVHERDREIYQDDYFWFSWYFVDLLDQTLCSHFRNNFPAWIEEVGGFPIPLSIQKSENGLIFVREKPSFILSFVDVPFNSRKWRDACSFFILNINYFLETKANVNPEAFLEKLVSDTGFNSPPNDFENLFAELIHDFAGV
mgnify:FL=1